MIIYLFNFFQILKFRIDFSDNSSTKILTLMKPIFQSTKMNGIPKIIISQVCRGESLNYTAQIDSVKASKYVNGQDCERISKICHIL